jgi:hypothetical protein
LTDADNYWTSIRISRKRIVESMIKISIPLSTYTLYAYWWRYSHRLIS